MKATNCGKFSWSMLRVVAGVALLAGLLIPGTIKTRDARAVGIFPVMLSSAQSAMDAYKNWAQGSETSLGDAVTSVHVVLAQGGLADNEIGVGYTSGANLQWSDGGSVAATSGGFRTMDGTDDRYFITSTLADIIAGTNSWSIVIKIKDYAVLTEQVFYLGDAGNNQVQIGRSGVDNTKAYFKIVIGGVTKLDARTASSLDAAGTFYVMISCDGTNYIGGFTASGKGAGGQPVKWSDFPSGQRVSSSATAAQFSTGAFTTTRALAYDGSAYANFSWAWVVLGHECLIDFSS